MNSDNLSPLQDDTKTDLPSPNPAITDRQNPDVPAGHVQDGVGPARQFRLNKPPKIFGVALAILIVISSATIGSYWFFVRIPDAKYNEAEQSIIKMLDSAAELKKMGAALGEVSLSKFSEQQKNDFYKQAQQYQSESNILRSNRAITDDPVVKTEYQRHKKAIEEYASSTVNLIETVAATTGIEQLCGDALSKLSQRGEDEITSGADFLEHISKCAAHIQEYPTVPIADFNKGYYEPYREAVLKMLKYGYTAFDAWEKANYDEMRSAENKFYDAYDEMKKVGSDRAFKLENSENPTDALKVLQTKVRDQKILLIRFPARDN